jgi:hypothetical protein
MSPLFTLVSDYIERMSNPIFGVAVNEDYTARFADLLGEQRMIPQLLEEAKNITDINTFTIHGWNWLLSWCLSDDQNYLSEKTLLNLISQWQSVSMMSKIIRVATLDASTPGKASRAIDEFPDQWLRELLQVCLYPNPGPDVKNYPEEKRGPNITFCLAVVLALMQVGTDLTIMAAATLLHSKWEGYDELLLRFNSRVELLDAETQVLWRDRLGVSSGG